MGKEDDAGDIAAKMHEIDQYLSDFPGDGISAGERAKALEIKDGLEKQRRALGTDALAVQEAANYAKVHRTIEDEDTDGEQNTEGE